MRAAAPTFSNDRLKDMLSRSATLPPTSKTTTTRCRRLLEVREGLGKSCEKESNRPKSRIPKARNWKEIAAHAAGAGEWLGMSRHSVVRGEYGES